ncbi:MAG: dihydrolipoyl dehydrogenase [Bacteriovoracaceae bacterium]|jgi:dihydrolipoamide dehydrogenase|nr:dihydrolipoyl dehydrogenase [Bacteriovoracaceae bacterium]
MKKFDYVIIGAGSAGLNARRQIAKHTDNWVVIDDGILGTTCARVGCMPSKVLIQVAADYKRFSKHLEQGILSEQPAIDHKKVMEHVRKLRDRFVRAVMGGMSNWINDEKLIRKRASFVDAHTLDLGDEKIQANKIIVATGSTPFIPDSLKPYSDYLITTDQFFELDKLPSSIAVVGLGVIGIELGQAIADLGIDTTLIARRRIIAGISDPQVNEYVCSKYEQNYNISFDGIKSISEESGKLKISLIDREIFVEKILVTTGRRPNLSSLKLENLELDLKKLDFCNKTFSLKEYPHIYVPGDVNGKKAILHEASDEGNIAGINSVFDNLKPFKTRVPLEITFSEPTIFKAGQSYESLNQNNISFEIGEVSFEGQGRSIVKLKEIGMLRVYGDKKTGLILGAEGFGPDSEHLAHLLAWVIEMNKTVNEVLSFPFYHPVIEEGLRTALRDLRSKCDIPVAEFDLKRI